MGTVVATVSVASVRTNPETGVFYIRFSDGSEVEGTLEQLQVGASLDPVETLRSVMLLRGVQGGESGLLSLAGHSASYIVGNSVIARAD